MCIYVCMCLCVSLCVCLCVCRCVLVCVCVCTWVHSLSWLPLSPWRVTGKHPGLCLPPYPFCLGWEEGITAETGDSRSAQDRLFLLGSGCQDWRLPGPHLHEIQEGTGLPCRGAEQDSVSVTPCSSSTLHFPPVFLAVTSHSISIGPEPRQGGRHSSCVFARGLTPPSPANHAQQATADSVTLATPVLCQEDGATMLFHFKPLGSPRGPLL